MSRESEQSVSMKMGCRGRKEHSVLISSLSVIVIVMEGGRRRTVVAADTGFASDMEKDSGGSNALSSMNPTRMLWDPLLVNVSCD